jgi:hypothetical protein
MQAFLDGIAEQCKVYGLTIEIIIVEWNPPRDRPRLGEILRASHDTDWVSVRIIEVPPEIHSMMNHSDSLNLFQMIAKNVGIRRARGEFVLATNVDILFSDELIEYIASKKLEGGKYYRADRYDVPYDVPRKRGIEEQLAYCRENLLRVNKKDFSIDLTTRNTLRIYPESKGLQDLRKLLWFLGPLMVIDFANRSFGGRLQEMRRRPRAPTGPSGLRRMASTWRHLRETTLKAGPRYSYIPAQRFVNDVELTIQPILLGFGRSLTSYKPKTNARMSELLSEILTLPSPRRPQLYTNACGDFTLMSRADWMKLRGYPEFQMYSLHVDSILLYQAHYGGVQEICLRPPIYHIDHEKGWAPFYFKQGHFRDVMRRAPMLSYIDFLNITEPMVRTGKNFLFNSSTWGLGGYELKESRLEGLEGSAPRAN